MYFFFIYDIIKQINYYENLIDDKFILYEKEE